MDKLSPEQIQELKDRLEELNPEALLPDGLEDALIGYVDQFSSNSRHYLPVISWELMMTICMERDGLTRSEAIEYLDFNVLGAYVSENQPVYFYGPDN